MSKPIEDYALIGDCQTARPGRERRLDRRALPSSLRFPPPVLRRCLELPNTGGLLSEEYDPEKKRLLGNFPQAFSHVGLVNTARNPASGDGPAKARSKRHKA